MKVEVHATEAVLRSRWLANTLERTAHEVAYLQSVDSARTIRQETPVRTGALASTVQSSRQPFGGQVTYGGSLRYKWPVEARRRMVTRAQKVAPAQFREAMTAAAAKEVARV